MNDGMKDVKGGAGTIVAALIAAATTSVIAAVTEALTLLKGDQRIACAVSNQTPFVLKQVIGKNGQPAVGQPVHGTYKAAPGASVPSLLTGASRVNGSSEWAESNNTAWALESRGSGTEVVNAYRIGELDLYLAFYAGNPVTGGPYAGVSLSHGTWFGENYGSEPKGGKLIDHIKKIHTDLCQISKDGAPRIVRSGEIEVDFTGAEQTVFTVKYLGDWSRFQEPNG